MQQLKNTSFADRQAAAAAAKQAILAKFKPKPTVQAPEPIDREKERADKAAALRAQRAAEKAAREHAKMQALANQVQAKLDAEARTGSTYRPERQIP